VQKPRLLPSIRHSAERLLKETWHASGWGAAANPPLRVSLDTVERPPDQAGRNN